MISLLRGAVQEVNITVSWSILLKRDVEGCLSLEKEGAGNCREMKCPGSQIYTVTTFRLLLDIFAGRTHGLLEMGSKLVRNKRLWYLVICGIPDI